MPTIIVKHLGPTNHRGSRLQVHADGFRKRTYDWDYSGSPEENYVKAMRSYAEANGLRGTYVVGMVRPDTYVFCRVDNARAYSVGPDGESTGP